MPLSQKIFRVFVSSTFADMKAERAILQEDVFKRLKEDCRKRGAVFQDIDLRWGVTEEATKTHQTMRICLNEIARCQNISPKPNFIVLLGDRYGWQPLPAEIPSVEGVAMRQVMVPEERQLFDDWYKEDTNAVPPIYILQSISDKADKWGNEEEPLRKLLREAAEKAGLSPSQKVKYFFSATHQEIISGALNPPPGTYDPREHVFCYIKKPVVIADRDILKDYVDFDKDGNPDGYCQKQLEDLKEALAGRLPADHIYPYPGVLEGKVVRPEKPEAFADRVYEDLKSIIFKQLEEFKEEDPLTQEIARHETFEEHALTDFTGREDAVNGILDYISGTDNRVYALVGDSGSGKTTVMARTVQLSRKRGNPVIISRFLGTTGNSTNMKSLLTQIDEQIAKGYGADINFMRGMGDRRKMEKDVFQECLMLAGQERPLLIFLDALDQLPEFGRKMLMDDIPKTLPAYCRIVVTGTPDVEPLFDAADKKSLSPMPNNEGETLLSAWLTRAGRSLRQDQRMGILERFSRNGLPLYLKLLFEDARQWHSYDITVPELPDDMEGMLREYFHGLESLHTKELISTVMGYLLCSRHKGLPENEVLELLARDEEYWDSFLKKYPFHSEEAIRFKRVPEVLWSRLYLDLEPYLTERTEDGTALLIFYHRQFSQFTLNTYIRGHEKRYYRHLGEYGEKEMRLSRKAGSPFGYSALYGLVYYLRAGMDRDIERLIILMFMEADKGSVNIMPMEKLAPYVIEEGSEEEKGRYKSILENCSLEMPEHVVWGNYLGTTAVNYSSTVFQQWSIFLHQKAIDIGENIHTKNPDNIVIADKLAVNYGNLGVLLQQSNRPEEAETYHQKAIGIIEKIQIKNPDNIDITNHLSLNYYNLGVLLRDSNRPEEAVIYYHKAIGTGENIQAKNPDNIVNATVLAANYGNLGLLLYQNNRPEEAVIYYQKAIGIREKIHTNNPDEILIANGLAENYGNLGVLLKDSNRPGEAVKYYQKAIDIREKIHVKNPGNIVIANGLAANYGNLGWLLQENNRPEEAVKYHQKAVDIREKIHAKNPDNILIANGLTTNYNNLGLLHQQRDRPEEAVKYYQKAIGIREKIHTNNPDDIDNANGLATNYYNLGLLLHESNRPEDALKYYQKAIDIGVKIYAKNPDNIVNANILATTYANLGALLQQSNRPEEAEPFLRKSIQIFLAISLRTGHANQYLQGAINFYAKVLLAMGKNEEEIISILRKLAPELFKEGY